MKSHGNDSTTKPSPAGYNHIKTKTTADIQIPNYCYGGGGFDRIISNRTNHFKKENDN